MAPHIHRGSKGVLVPTYILTVLLKKKGRTITPFCLTWYLDMESAGDGTSYPSGQQRGRCGITTYILTVLQKIMEDAGVVIGISNPLQGLYRRAEVSQSQTALWEGPDSSGSLGKSLFRRNCRWRKMSVHRSSAGGGERQTKDMKKRLWKTKKNQKRKQPFSQSQGLDVTARAF